MTTKRWHFVCGIQLIAVLLLSLQSNLDAQVQPRPLVVVEVNTDHLTDEFDPQESEYSGTPAKIKSRLEHEFVKLVREPYRIFRWQADEEASPAVSHAARLLLTFRVVPGVTPHVFLELEFVVGATHIPLLISVPDIYPDRQPSWPSSKHIENRTVTNAKTALTTMLGSEKKKWNEQFIRNVPIATDLLPAPPTKQWLVLPLKANELLARDDSLFHVKLRTDHPAKGRQPSFFQLKAGGEEQSAGRQRCDLEEFRFDGLTHKIWVPDIAIVIEHRVPQSVVVTALKYERDYSNPSSSSP